MNGKKNNIKYIIKKMDYNAKTFPLDEFIKDYEKLKYRVSKLERYYRANLKSLNYLWAKVQELEKKLV